MTAILLAFFLGLLGAHWFYLKNKNRAILYLVGGTVGCFLFIPPFVVAIFSIIDAVTWLGWSDQRFKNEFIDQYNAM